VIYALRPDGAVAAAVRVRDVAGYDWEAIAAYQDPGGRAMIAVGDIGDNLARRASVQIVLLDEPALHDATVTPRRVLQLRYPDGSADAEALLVDPGAGRMYVVTKGLGSTVYQVPVNVWPGSGGAPPQDDGTFTRIATVPLILVTDGVMGPGHHPLLRTYGELAVLPPVTPGVVGGSLQPLAVAALPAQPQGEGVALDRDGDVLLASEGRDQPILRLPVPGPLAAVLGAPAPPGAAPAGSGPAEGTRPAGSAGSADQRVQASSWWPVLGAAVVLAAVAGAIAGRIRRRQGR
jgi:hypothetical protein